MGGKDCSRNVAIIMSALDMCFNVDFNVFSICNAVEATAEKAGAAFPTIAAWGIAAKALIVARVLATAAWATALKLGAKDHRQWCAPVNWCAASINA